MTAHNEHPPAEHIPDGDEPSLPELEANQAVPPRPEEDVADELRAEPDLDDHSREPE